MSAPRVFDDDDDHRKDPWPPPPPPPPGIALPAGDTAGGWSAHSSAYVPAGSADANLMPTVTVFSGRRE